MENRPNVSVPVKDLNSFPNASSTLKRRPTEDIPKAKPKQEQIVKSDHVSVKKQSAWKKAKHRIFEQEGAELKNYVVNDVLIPSIKDTISNIVANGIDILLYGEAHILLVNARVYWADPRGMVIMFLITLLVVASLVTLVLILVWVVALVLDLVFHLTISFFKIGGKLLIFSIGCLLFLLIMVLLL